MLTIAILGGTGKEGKGLGWRWANAGHHILIGSRSTDKANNAASEIRMSLNSDAIVEGTTNHIAASKADVVVLTVPYSAHRSVLEEIRDVIQDKILVDVTVPLVPHMTSKVHVPVTGSAAQEACEILGERVQVASAFHNIPYKALLSKESIACEVLVTGTSKQVRAETLKLVEDAGLIGWDAGPIENSIVLEGLASVLIHINKHYGSFTAGIKIIGVSRPDLNQ